MSSERVLLDSSVGGLRDWWWSAHRRSGLGVWRTALHWSHGGEWWQQSTTRHWEPTSTDDWKRVMHWRRCMMDCITLESLRGALKDICHPPLKADQWHQLTTRNWTLASRGRVVWRTDDSRWSHDNCVLPSTEIKQDPLARYADGGGCGAVDQQCNRLLLSVVKNLNAPICVMLACYWEQADATSQVHWWWKLRCHELPLPGVTAVDAGTCLLPDTTEKCRHCHLYR